MRTHVPGLLFLMICVACGGGEKAPIVDPPTTGRLQGVAVLSGADNSEGVEVHVLGTALRTLTGPTGAYSLATVPDGLSEVVSLAAGDWHSLALKADGTVVAWGSRQAGQGVVPPGASNVIAVAAGGAHNLVLAPHPPREGVREFE